MLATLIINNFLNNLGRNRCYEKKSRCYSEGDSKIEKAFYKTNFPFKISFLIFKLILQPHRIFSDIGKF